MGVLAALVLCLQILEVFAVCEYDPDVHGHVDIPHYVTSIEDVSSYTATSARHLAWGAL